MQHPEEGGGGGFPAGGGGGGGGRGFDKHDVAALMGGCLRACMRGRERIEDMVFAADASGRIGIADFGGGSAQQPDLQARTAEDRLREWQEDNDRKERAAAAAAARGETLRDPNEIDIGQLGSDEEAVENVDNPLAGDETGDIHDAYDEADLYADLLDEHIEPLDLPLVPALPEGQEEQGDISGPKAWEEILTPTMYKALALELLMWSMPDEWWHDEMDQHNEI